MEMKMEELDKELKIRMMRLLWSSGHFVRSNIPLYSVDGEYKGITDIDVLAIAFGPDFSARTTICDCKTGVGVSTPERIFWTSGVIRYFRADRGFFVRSKILESRYVDLADRLGLLPLSEDQLKNFEDVYNIQREYFIGPFKEENLYLENNRFKNLKEADSKAYHYIKVKYWIDYPHTQILSLMAYVKKINESDKLSNEAKFFFRMYVLSLLSVSLINFARKILVISPLEREEQIKERLMGGKVENYEKKALLENFYDFIKAEIESKYYGKYPVTKVDFLAHFYPSYTKYVIDLVQRLCSSPIQSIAAPQLMDLITYELALKGDGFGKKDIPFHSISYIKTFLKPTKDMITFGERTGILPKENVDKIKETLNKLEE